MKKKRSLIRILYIYPVMFFMIGLSMIITYYTWQQIQKYDNEVEKLRSEFPKNQRNELKSKVLLLKDYIAWVRSHPEEQIIQHLNRKVEHVEVLMRRYKDKNQFSNTAIPLELCDSLDKLNETSVVKVFILNSKKQAIYPEASKGNKLTKMPAEIYPIQDYQSADAFKSLSGHHKSVAMPWMLFKTTAVSGISIGIAYSTGQNNEILQEVVLDSLSNVKFSNHEYVIVNTFNGYALLSRGKRQLPPLNIRSSSETNWKDIFAKELEFANKPDGGFYTYFWRNRSDVERSEKTSYFSGIHDWEWIIGTGFFANDIDPIIKQMNADLWKDISDSIFSFLVFLVILSIFAYLIMRFFAEKAKSNILLFLHFFKRADQGIQIIDTSKLAFTEFATLAEAANLMIHERERIKSVLSDEKSRLRYMIDAIPDLIFFKDTESKFLGCNKAFEKYINKKSEEIIGLSEHDLFDKTLASEYLHSDRVILQTLEPERITNWIEYPNGERCRYYTLKTPYFDSDNNLLGIIGISRDITEMEETRQRLILAKEKAEESDRLKTAFLANMSHEIRTPMNAIIGFSDLLAEEDLSQEDKIDFISKIKNAGRLLMSLINDIIDIAKIESGQLIVTESVCDVNQMLIDLHGIFEELKNTSGKQSLRLRVIIPDTVNPVMVVTDPTRLQQIFTNLLSNALKFTETGTIEFGYSVRRDELLFYVKDSGIGILPEKQKLLFQRFSQLDPSTTRKYGGSGLGLAISKNLVELLGGTIDLESEPLKGSTFYFTIPFKEAANKKSNYIKNDLQHINWKGKTILIAEDMMQNFMLMEALLRRSEVRLIHAVNGQDAIDIVRSEPDINLILMDIQLPLKTGYEALKEILELRPDIPIMSYTAFALPHEREKSLNAGFVDFIPKPIKTETLIPLLDKYLRNQG